MKRIIIIGAVLLAVSGSLFGSYYFGYLSGNHDALILQRGTFVGTLDALEKIRAGDVSGATERIETLCFSSANIVYGEFVLQHDFSGRGFNTSMITNLKNYRQTFRTNQAEWTPMEQSLEAILANWK